jgi:hypothetical protein
MIKSVVRQKYGGALDKKTRHPVSHYLPNLLSQQLIPLGIL